MEIESTVKIINEADIKERPGIVPGQVVKGLVGSQTPTERISVSIATFEPGTYEWLHWHLIEVAYYVISGHAVVKDVNGKTYNLDPGSLLYAGPGLAGAHSWEAKEQFQLVVIRATSDPSRTYPQFNMENEQNKEFVIKFDSLVRSGLQKQSLY